MFSYGIQKNLFYTEWLLIAAIIIISDDTLFFGTNSNSFFISFKFAFIVTTAIVLFFKNFLLEGNIQQNAFLYLFIFSSLILLSSFWNNDYSPGVFYRILLLILAFSITQKIKLEIFADFFSKTILYLCAYSLFLWIINSLFPSVFSFLPILKNSAGAIYYNALFAQINSIGMRNTGIFREPGIFQMFICIAILFQIFLKKQNIHYSIAILSVTLITTFSTTGYLAFFILTILYLKNFFFFSKSNKKKILVFFVLSFIVYFFFSSELFDIVFGKFGDGERHTTIARYASISENFRIFAENPIFGVNLNKLGELFPAYTKKYYGFASVHNTNTLLIQFALHGFLFGFLIIYLQYKFCKKLFLKRIDALIAFIMFVIIYCGENQTFSVIPYIFLFYGIEKKETSTY